MIELKKVLLVVFGFVSTLGVFLSADRPLWLGVGLLAVIAVSLAGYFLKKIKQADAAVSILSYITFFSLFAFYVIPSQAISVQSAPILDDNWWTGLNWIRENTQECATIATYWDPGHFIRAIAKRPVVFDGASQNSLHETPYDGKRSGLEILRHDNGILRMVNYNAQRGLIERARIKDIGSIMLTSNESLAAEILKDYRKEGCNEVYFLATSDLIPKSVWWTCFATWDPTKPEVSGQQCSKGNPLSYVVIPRARTRPIPALGIVGLEYPAGDGSIILCQNNGTIAPCRPDTIGFFQAGDQFVKLKRIIIPHTEGLLSLDDATSQFPGTVLVLDSSGQSVMFLPDQLADAMFTRMFLYNGAGLERFELIQNWGNEVKLFKVNVD